MAAPATAEAAAPSLTGNPYVGATLTLTPGDPAASSETWQSCTPAGVCAPVQTSGNTYTVAATDLGNTIQVLETDADLVTTTQTSNAIGPITQPPPPPPPPAPSVTSAPTLSSGTPQEGQPISVTNGTWSPSPTSPYGYQWYQCNGSCSAISGANNQTYTPGPQQVGLALEASVTASDSGGSSSPAYAGPTAGVQPPAVVPPPAPKASSAPTISGSAVQGATLTANPGKFSDSSAGYSYQWRHCSITCSDVPGATGSTYLLTDADVGTQLEVIVTASNTGGSGSATSSRTAIVTAATTTSLLASPSSVGINQTVMLAAVVTSGADTADPSGTVTVNDDGAAIPGCSALPVTGNDQSVTVTCATSFGLGSSALSATFTPSSSAPLTGSSSPTEAISVSPDQSITTLDVPTTIKRGEAVTYTATVTPADDLTGPVVPAGTVGFSNQGHPIRGCVAVPLQNGAATCTATYRSTGTERISAQYAGSDSFGASSASARTVHVVRTVSAHGRRAAGSITATMQWTFHYTPRYTRVLALVVHGLPARSLVTVGCSGHGCPFAMRTHKVTRALKRMSIQSAFHQRRLRVRSKVIVTITRSRYVGEYYRFTVKSRHPPSVLISCLAPGSKRPGVGCRR